MSIAIYGLCAPGDKTIRYVGQTGNPESRLKRHIGDAKRGKSYPVQQWIRDLLNNGQQPVMVILDPDAYDFSNAKEAAWTCEMEKISPLLNVNVRKRQDTILDFAGLERHIAEHKRWQAEAQERIRQLKEKQAPPVAEPLPAVEPDITPYRSECPGETLLTEATNAAKGEMFDQWWRENGTKFVKGIHAGEIRWTHQQKEPERHP